MNRSSASIARVVALRAANWIPKHGNFVGLQRKAQELCLFISRLRVGSAMRTKEPNEALGNDANQACAEQEGIDIHVEKSGDGAGSVVAVKGAEH